MCLDELKEICSIAKLFDIPSFIERECNISFNLSMMTQVDELDSDRIFQMSFIEFLEAVARIAEKVNIQVAASSVESVSSPSQGMALALKMEGLILHVLRHLHIDVNRNNRSALIALKWNLKSQRSLEPIQGKVVCSWMKTSTFSIESLALLIW